MDLLDTQLHSVLGEEAFVRLVGNFYKRVPADEILAPLYPKDDLPGAEIRLREFLIQRFGGPEHYSQKRGHPRLRMRHAPFAVDQRTRDRWIALMEAAMAESQLPAETIAPLRNFFAEAATFLINRDG